MYPAREENVLDLLLFPIAAGELTALNGLVKGSLCRTVAICFHRQEWECHSSLKLFEAIEEKLILVSGR